MQIEATLHCQETQYRYFVTDIMVARITEEKGRSRSNCTVPSSVDSWLLAGLLDCLFISGRHFEQLRKDLELQIMRRGQGGELESRMAGAELHAQARGRPFRPFWWSAATAGVLFVSRALKMNRWWCGVPLLPW